MRGQDYNGRGKSETGKAVFNKPRSARRMLSFCNCRQGMKEKAFKCKKFLEEKRQHIVTGLNWQERKHYIKALVDLETPVKRKCGEPSQLLL